MLNGWLGSLNHHKHYSHGPPSLSSPFQVLPPRQPVSDNCRCLRRPTSIELGLMHTLGVLRSISWGWTIDQNGPGIDKGKNCLHHQPVRLSAGSSLCFGAVACSPSFCGSDRRAQVQPGEFSSTVAPQLGAEPGARRVSLPKRLDPVASFLGSTPKIRIRILVVNNFS